MPATRVNEAPKFTQSNIGTPGDIPLPAPPNSSNVIHAKPSVMKEDISKEKLEEIDRTKPLPPGWTRGDGGKFLNGSISTYLDPRVTTRKLPQGYEQRGDGTKVWFYNSITTQNTDLDPRLILPTGWEETKDSQGRPYFINRSQGYTTFSDPRLIYV